MTKDELLADLRACAQHDKETAHIMADGALLRYINDAEITAAYEAIPMWYA